MSQTRISFGCFTLVVTDELLILAVNASALPPAAEKPSLHKRGWRAEHLTIPFEPRTSGPLAGTYWVHLTYPDKSHVGVAALDPEKVKAIGGELGVAYEELLREHLQGCIRKVDASWLAERGYEIVFMAEDDCQALIDAHFRCGKRKYRIPFNRLEEIGEKMLMAEPSILDCDAFRSDPPKHIQAICLERDEAPLNLWRFPSGSDGTFGWYAAPTHNLMPPPAKLLSLMGHVLGAGFWDAIHLICTELGVPLDEVFFQFVEAVKTGQFNSFLKDFALEPAA